MNALSFDHLYRLSDNIGIFEHADHTAPRREHGYCVDDVARLLIVIAREPEPARPLRDLEHVALRFVANAQTVDGRVRNRRNASGRWTSRRSVEDCWGRSLWAFGTAANQSCERANSQSALAYFAHGARQRSSHLRSMAFAALGAAEVLAVDPRHLGARLLLADAATRIGRPSTDRRWPWPEPRLAYANAAVPEALIAAGSLLDRSELVADGMSLLRWLLDRETVEGHLSPTPVGGSGPGDTAPKFDQQAIEVAAMADACHRAYVVSGQTEWLTGVQMAVGWFTGDNDSASPMIDAESGGGYDGLHAAGPNFNQGAESTLAMLATLQVARRFDIVAT